MMFPRSETRNLPPVSRTSFHCSIITSQLKGHVGFELPQFQRIRSAGGPE
jgi:hypothetical protein